MGCSRWDPWESLRSLLDLAAQAFTLGPRRARRCARSRRGGRVAEGTRLLSEYGAKSSIAGSNPALSAVEPRRHAAARLSAAAPVAQLDRASVYGTEGQRFESSRAR